MKVFWVLLIFMVLSIGVSSQPATTSQVNPILLIVAIFKQLLNLAGWIVIAYLILFYIKKKFGKKKSESMRRFEALIETAEDMCPDALKGNKFEIGPTEDIGGKVLGTIVGVGRLAVQSKWRDPNPEYPDDFAQKIKQEVPYDKELVFIIKQNVGIGRLPLFNTLAKKKVYRVPGNVKRCVNIIKRDGKRYLCDARVKHNPNNSRCWRCNGPVPVYHSFPLSGSVRIYTSGFDKVGKYYFPNERDDGEILHTMEMDSLNLKYMQMLDMNVEVVESAVKMNPRLQVRKELNEDAIPGKGK